MGITGRFQRYILENYNAAGELNQSTALRWLVTPPNPNQPIILSMKKDDQISFASNRLAVQKFKIVLVGDQNAGKSSIIVRYIKNDFDKTNNVWNIRTQPTIGIDFTSKNVSINGRTVRLQLWDTAGQQRFRSLIPSYLKDCNMAIIVFDITAETTSEGIMKWVDFVRESRGNEAIIYLVGNKMDLEGQRRTDSVARAKDVAKQQNIPYFEVSAKSGEGINEMFSEVTDKLLTCQTGVNPSSTQTSISSLPKQQKQEMVAAPLQPPQLQSSDKIKLSSTEKQPTANNKLCC